MSTNSTLMFMTMFSYIFHQLLSCIALLFANLTLMFEMISIFLFRCTIWIWQSLKFFLACKTTLVTWTFHIFHACNSYSNVWCSWIWDLCSAKSKWYLLLICSPMSTQFPLKFFFTMEIFMSSLPQKRLHIYSSIDDVIP